MTSNFTGRKYSVSSTPSVGAPEKRVAFGARLVQQVKEAMSWLSVHEVLRK